MRTDLDRIISLLFVTLRREREHLHPPRLNGGLSFLHMISLRYVMEEQNPTMKSLAEFLSITSPSATSLIEGLAKRELIARMEDPADRRVVRLRTTAKGRALLKEALRGTQGRLRVFFSRLDAKERRNFVAILKKLSQS